MKLITLNQLVSSLETTKEYIDKTVGNISTGSNIDTDNLVITNSISIGRKEDATVGAGSTAVGSNVTASGSYSHAEGCGTVAASEYQHVQGQFNIEDSANTYAHIVGNGTATVPSNAHTLDWNGNAWFAGNVKVGSGNKELATTDHTHNYLPLTGGTLTGNLTCNQYLKINALTGYGTGSANIWYDGSNAALCMDTISSIKIGNYKVYHEGNKPSPADIGAATGNHDHTKSSNSTYRNAYVWIDSSGYTCTGCRLDFVDGVFDEDTQCCSIFAENSSANTGSHKFYCWGHWNSGDVMGVWDLGSSTYMWGKVYAYNGIATSSDRNLKENINYIRNNEISLMDSMEDEIEEQDSNNFTYSDLYDFVKTDLELATYNYKGKEENSLGFIAQDLLYNADGTDNKIGQFIVPPVVALTESELEEKKAEFEAARKREATAEELKELATPKLEYNQTNYISVLAGALKETIKQVEELKDIVAQQQELINQLLDNK